MYLMLGDNEVLYFDFDEFIVEVINHSLIPYALRGALVEGNSKKNILNNVSLLKEWLSSRLLSLSRDNIKQLCTVFGLPQVSSVDTRVEFCIKCNAVSLIDSYWVCRDKSVKYVDVNLRHKRFKDLYEISLLGINPSVTSSLGCPELTTQGVFRKSWVREDNKLYLLKSDRHSNNVNTRMEVLAFELLSCFGNRLDSVSYSGRMRNTKVGKLFVDKCELFVDDKYSFVEAWEYASYAKRIGLDFKKQFMVKEGASIPVLDFILVNTDRHQQNYGFMMDNKTGQIVRFAPLFDFNCALVSDYFGINAVDTLSQMFNDGSSLKKLADMYNPYSRVVFYDNKFDELRKKHKQYSQIFDNVLRRCNYMGLV